MKQFPVDINLIKNENINADQYHSCIITYLAEKYELAFNIKFLKKSFPEKSQFRVYGFKTYSSDGSRLKSREMSTENQSRHYN